MKKILLALKTLINLLSFPYDYFFKKFNGSSLDSEYANKIKKLKTHNQSFVEWEFNLELIKKWKVLHLPFFISTTFKLDTIIPIGKL